MTQNNRVPAHCTVCIPGLAAGPRNFDRLTGAGAGASPEAEPALIFLAAGGFATAGASTGAGSLTTMLLPLLAEVVVAAARLLALPVLAPAPGSRSKTGPGAAAPPALLPFLAAGGAGDGATTTLTTGTDLEPASQCHKLVPALQLRKLHGYVSSECFTLWHIGRLVDHSRFSHRSWKRLVGRLKQGRVPEQL